MAEQYVGSVNAVERVFWRLCLTRSARLATLISVTSGIAMAIVMMILGWSHNSQGEFHIDGIVYWAYWLWIGFTWLLGTTAMLLPPTFTLAFVSAVVRNRIAT